MDAEVSQSGILIVDKPGGMTSHQVVGAVRRAFRTKKVGHAGTLDPMATGVLICGVNRATRLLGHLALHDKAYHATIRLGMATNTDDADGEQISRADASSLDSSQIEAAMQPLRGEIMQVPSTVSAIKVDGKRAYARARAGEEVALAARPVTVSSFIATDIRRVAEFVDVDVDVECSAGTYVRALARDLGAALGVGGHLTALRRTRIGQYSLADAIPLTDLPGELMTMARAAQLSFPTMTVSAEQAVDVSLGRGLPIDAPAAPTGLLNPNGELIALYGPAERHATDDRVGAWARPIAVLI